MPLTRHDFSPEELRDQLALERGREPFIVLRDGLGKQLLVPLEGEKVSVGRDRENHVALTWDPEASRIHALFERLGGHWTVVDDRLSRNGTFVNGNLLRGRRRLDDHDLLRIGSTHLAFRDPAGTGAETPPVSSRAELAGVSPAQKRVLVSLCRPLFDSAHEGETPPSNPEIATELQLSVEAVRTHMKALFRLFDVPDLAQNRKRAELARRALASGVVVARDLTA